MIKKKVLIIGGLGFIGSHLAEECLNQGYDVTILSRSKSKIFNIKGFADKVKLIIKDIACIGEEVAEFDLIIDMSGSVATNDQSIIDGNTMIDIEMNCVNSIKLLDSLKNHNPQCKVLYSSTFNVNGQPDKLPVDPNSPCKPLSLYGATKLTAEHFCHIYNNIFDMKAIVIRFTNIFGVRELSASAQKGRFNYMISQAVKGYDLNLYNNGDFFRDFLYVTDAARACLTIAEKGSKDQIYYVGRGEFIKFKELVDLIVRHTGVSINHVETPDFHNRVGIQDFVCDNTPLKLLGWTPEVSIEEGIKKTINYYRSLGEDGVE